MLLDLARGALPALVRGGFNWVDARDVVDGALAAADRGEAGRAYILSGHWASLAGLAAHVHASCGTRPPAFVSPMWLARAAAPAVAAASRLAGRRPRYTPEALAALRGHRQVSHDRATAELGYTPRPLARTVSDTIDWFQTQGWLDDLGGRPLSR